MKKNLLLCLMLIGMVFAGSARAHVNTAEPLMIDYTAMPVFTDLSVPPNIMIILDNSGSMNFCAYGTYPGDRRTVVDEPYTGEPYSGIKTFQIISGQDDAEEGVAVGSAAYSNDPDLDLGGFSVGSNDSIVGLRFQKVAIPRGMTIHTAYIEFTSRTLNGQTTNILIEGEASDNADPFAATVDNLKNRIPTEAKVQWTDVPEWAAGVKYPTAEIKEIVQEIIDRDGWASGNAMVFRFTGILDTDNKRDAQPYESGAANAAKLHVVFGRDPASTRYYGYFSPDYFYTYSSKFNMAYRKVSYNYTSNSWNVEGVGADGNLNGVFESLTNTQIVSKGLWDGNWVNWLSMRRVDVLRKVLMGGLATARTGGGNQTNYGETPAQKDRIFYKNFDSSIGSAVSPYYGNQRFRIEGGYIYLGDTGTRFTLAIQKNSILEAEDFMGGNLSGVLQRVGHKARWGNIWFNHGTGKGQSGGTVAASIGTNVTSLITDLQNTSMTTFTPLAEAYYVAMQYFKQEAVQSGLDYPNNPFVVQIGGTKDPYYHNGAGIHCAKSFVILLTDGASTCDAMIPSEYHNYSGHNKTPTNCSDSSCHYPQGGSHYLADLALYARTNDLRPDLEGEQNLILYVIHAFDNDPNAITLLMDAARNGGFDDRNGNKRPDLAKEWDKDGDGIPDTYFHANDGYQLQARLMSAIHDIMQRAASGTASSVLATNSEGEGHMLQAYFRPIVTAGLEEGRWFGYLQSLWVDADGNLREDSNGNGRLDDEDLVIEFVTGDNGDTMVKRGEGILPLEEIRPIFEAGKLLRDRVPGTRHIFTHIDFNLNGIVDDGANPFNTLGEVFSFESATAANIKPFLGVANDTVWGGVRLGATHDQRVANIIEWVRGTDIDGLRNRTLAGETWRLGDIVNSTPVTVNRPPDQYHVMYGDESYLHYWEKFKGRESVVYVGANDGMLHAFTHGTYSDDINGYVTRSTEKLGDELWAFIPQMVLPHLKWIAHSGYTHTYLVDGKPRIFDARILPNDTHYHDPNGGRNWGTFLLMGLNMGAKHIHVRGDFGSGLETRLFDPSYFMLDITDPRNPRVMWERTYPDLGMSLSRPVPIKVGDKWFLVFGSGPTDYDGVSNKAGYLYVADLATGALLRKFGPLDTQAFFNDPAAFDKNLNFNVDAIYAGTSFYESSRWQGSMYKINVRCENPQWSPDYDSSKTTVYSTDPGTWTLSKLFASSRPITAPASVSVESYADMNIDNVWVYFGTGRYLSKLDAEDSSQEYLYGIKDPFFNTRDETYWGDYDNARTLSVGDLLRTDTITVTTGQAILQGASHFNDDPSFDFWAFEKVMQEDYAGWYRLLDTNGTAPSERVVSKPTLLGGMVFVPVFTPDSSICGFGGLTNVYALYYATGTGYFRQIFNLLDSEKRYIEVRRKDGQGNETVTKEEVVEVKLPRGFIGTPPPSAGMHVGRRKGAKAFLQQSTGRIMELEVTPPFFFRSGIIDWWDQSEIDNEEVGDNEESTDEEEITEQ